MSSSDVFSDRPNGGLTVVILIFVVVGTVVLGLLHTPPMAFCLNIKVIEAKDLLAADSNGFSDPFVDVEINTKFNDKKHDVKKTTKIIKKNLNPVWNEEFTFKVDNIARLDFKVWDHDMVGSNDHIGTCFLDITNIPMGVYTDFWIPLPIKGSLHVAVNPLNFVPAMNVTPGYLHISGPLVFPHAKAFAVKQKFFSITEKMRVIDKELQCDMFQVSERYFSWGHQIRLSDMSGSCLMFISQTAKWPLPHFKLFFGGNGGVQTYKIDKKFTFFTPKFKIYSKDPKYPEITIHGDWLAFTYKFEQNGIVIAEVDRKFSLRDEYRVTVLPQVDVGLILSCCIIIDRVVTDKRKNDIDVSGNLMDAILGD